eukprot:1566775-Rhodomonas_salina.1
MPQMEELNLSHNTIGSLEGLGPYARLQELNLMSNLLESLAGLKGCGQIRVLKLNNNNITDLKGIQRVPLLEELYIAGNQLKNCGEIVASACPNLEFLDVSANAMSDLNEVQKIGSLACLIDLKLAGNPMCQNELFLERARMYLAAVDTVDEQDFRRLRIDAAKRELADAQSEEGAEQEEGDDATGTVLDRGVRPGLPRTRVCSVQCAGCSVQCEVRSVQSAVCAMCGGVADGIDVRCVRRAVLRLCAVR